MFVVSTYLCILWLMLYQEDVLTNFTTWPGPNIILYDSLHECSSKGGLEYKNYWKFGNIV